MKGLGFFFMLILFIAMLSGAGALHGNQKKQSQDCSCDGGGSGKISAAGSLTDFGFDMYGRLADREKNVMISPVSIHLALAMTLNGARGETASQMQSALKIDERVPMSDIRSSSRELLYYYGELDPKVILNIADSFWYDKSLSVLPSYVAESREYFDAEVIRGIEINAVNRWVDEKTEGKIKKILTNLNGVDAILLNAVYFKGSWTDEFDKELTAPHPFHGPQGSYDVSMMSRPGARLDYFETEDYQAVRLPYGGGKLAMYVFLPSEASGLGGFISQFGSADWQDVRTRFSEAEVNILLPRFKAEYEAELNTPLMNMGMRNAFGRAADFSGMTGASLFISLVKHKTFIEVNEEGTEAAAVTAVIMTRSMMRPERKNFTADRPFFYIIADSERGIPLFMGSVVKPDESKK